MKHFLEEKTMIESMGGVILNEKYIVFPLKESPSNDGGESITLPQAKQIEAAMMQAGYPGALIGDGIQIHAQAIYFFLEVDTIAIHEKKKTEKVIKQMKEYYFTDGFLKLYNDGDIYGCYFTDSGEIVADDKQGNTLFNILK